MAEHAVWRWSRCGPIASVDVEDHWYRHRLRRVGKLDYVDLSNVGSRRQRTSIRADGNVRRRVATAAARWRDTQPAPALARCRDRREAHDGAGAGDAYHLRRGIHAHGGIEGDGRKLNEDWIAYRDRHGNGHVASRGFQHLLPDVRARNKALARQLRVDDGHGVGSGVDARDRSYRDPLAGIRGGGRDAPVQRAATSIAHHDGL
jgi:hypothetical protein